MHRRARLEQLEPRYLLAQSVWAFPNAAGQLLYQTTPLGDRLADFGNVGYRGGTVPIPDVPVAATVNSDNNPATDDTAVIQAAIDAVEALPLAANGFRGAVLLGPGDFQVGTDLDINASGVVLRGSGVHATRIMATGTGQRTIIQVSGSSTRTNSGSAVNVLDEYVPVGAISFRVSSTSGLSVGQQVLVRRLANQDWINDIGMNLLDNPWTPSGYTITMDRTITRIDGNTVTLDGPVTQAIDSQYGGGTLQSYTDTRISNVGVEHLSGESAFNSGVPDDEDHPWRFIQLSGVEHGWVRHTSTRFFGNGNVSVVGASKWVTVSDSQCLDPVSVITGGRRYSFNQDDSSYVLWRNLYARDGRHDYVQGSNTAGPNVFVDSRADEAHSDTGPHHRYSTVALWDSLDVNGHSLNIQNRHNSGTGHGWAGANQVAWNSAANNFTIQNPPTAQNWAIGNIGNVQTGNPGLGTQGIYDSHGTNVETRSLYYAQLADRLNFENLAYRELRAGDHDGYAAGDSVDVVTVDPTWRTNIQTATGRTGVNFDTASAGQLVPFTFSFTLAPGERIVGASLNLGVRSSGGSAAGDQIYFEDVTRVYDYAELGTTAPDTAAGARAIDLSRILAALQDGKLNVAIEGNTAVDWAVLNLRTASTVQPNQTTLNPVADATVRDGSSAAANFGTSATIDTKLDTTNNRRESYLKFDLTSFTAAQVARATIRLVPTTVGYADLNNTAGVGAMFNQVSFVPGDDWTETGINWNNKPVADPAFHQFLSQVNAPVTFDVTELVRGALAGDETLSLKFESITQNTTGQISFGARENGNANVRPQLILQTFDGVSAVADATVRGGVNANTPHGTQSDLGVKNDSATSADNDREAFLRFDLTALPGAPANAFVRLVPFAVPATLTHTAALVNDDAWSEAAITWNNKPAASGTTFGTWTPALDSSSTFNVTSSAAAAFATDKLLSVKVSSVTAASAAPVQYGSRENADLTLRPALISTNLKPLITDVPAVETGLNTPVTGLWFGVWDAETPASSLTLGAASSNPTLLPVGNITFAGSGSDRTISLTPASGQFGASNVTITVADAQGQTAQSVFQFVVDGSVPVNGDQSAPNQDDVLRVVRNGANVNIFRNGTLVIDQAIASAPGHDLNGLGGNDTLIVDYTAGNPIPAGGLTLDGGSGNDIVRLVGTSGADAVTLTAGNVALGSGGNFDYAGGETLELQLGAGTDTLAVAGNSAVTTPTFLLTLAGGGSLAMAAGATLPDFTDVSVASGTTFNLGGQNQTIDALSGNGTALNTGSAAATLTVGAQGSGSTFAGSLANGTQTLALTKVGAGTLVLSGVNSYTGISTISGGAIQSGTAASFAGLSGVVRFNGGTFRVTADTVAANVQNKWTTAFTGAPGTNTGTFDIAAGVTLTLGAAGGPAAMRTAGDGSGGQFIKTGTGTLRLVTGNNQQDDPLLLSQGTILAEHPDALGRGDSGVRVDMKSGTTLALKNNAATNFQTPINSADAGGTVNLVLDRQTAGAGVTHSLNALTSAGAFTLNVSAGANITSGVAGLTLGSATLGGNGTFNVTSSAVATVSGALGGAFGLTKTGAGTMTLAGAAAYTGATTVNAGTLVVTQGIKNNAALAIADVGRVVIPPAAPAGYNPGVEYPTGSNATASKVSSLSITGAGQLDLGNSDLVINYSGASPLDAVRDMLASGYSGGAWDGVGIVSAAALGTDPSVFSLGCAENADLPTPYGAGANSFFGTDVDDTCVLIKFTWIGDLSLDGLMTFEDLSVFNTNFDNGSSTGRRWTDGDFNYDGLIDFQDLSVFNTNYDPNKPQV